MIKKNPKLPILKTNRKIYSKFVVKFTEEFIVKLIVKFTLELMVKYIVKLFLLWGGLMRV